MALTSKSLTKSSVAEKKVKASRKVESKVVPPAQQEEELLLIEEVKEVQELKEEELKEEEFKEEVKQEIKEEVKEELKALKVANLPCDDETLC